jgi:ELWxxDGT repeat protein
MCGTPGEHAGHRKERPMSGRSDAFFSPVFGPVVPRGMCGTLRLVVLRVALAAALAIVTLPASASAEPFLVKDINPDGKDSSPAWLTNVGGTLFFVVASDPTYGAELWKSDGTKAGTVLVKDINPDSEGSFPYELTNVGGTLFFSVNDGTSGRELWKSDGTAAGTVLVKDIDPDRGGASPGWLTKVGGTLFFEADDGTSGRELWALVAFQ